MNNEEIIARVAVQSGAFSAEEIGNMISDGRDIPLHTYQGWRERGKTVKKGEHGIQCQLWKLKSKPKGKEIDTDVEDRNKFYLTKSYLFRLDQVEEGVEHGLV